jgi:hypothetical protein
MSKRIGRSAAGKAELAAASDRRQKARDELRQGRMARLDVIDLDRKKMTQAEVREAVADVARVVHALIRAL